MQVITFLTQVLLFAPGMFLLWIGITLKMGFFGLCDRRTYWSRDTPMPVDYHFADFMSKAMWEQILAALETPTAPEPPEPEGLNISSQPREAPVRFQPDATTAE